MYKPWRDKNEPESVEKPQDVKDVLRILIVDDDTRFRVAKILQTSGWVHTKLVKDIESMESPMLKDANIVFVDIQGVGKVLGFQEEGLGLAKAIKDKYPHKKLVIYSAETKGDRFHSALRDADSFLNKNADPYEFEQLVETFSEELLSEGKI